MSDDEFDNIPDDFADVQDIDWAHLLAGSSRLPQVDSVRPRGQPEPEIPPHSNSLDSPSSYFSDGDEMDASFLAELARIEQRIIEAPIVAPHLPTSAITPVTMERTDISGSSSAVAADPLTMTRDPRSSDAPEQLQMNQSSERRSSHYFQGQMPQSSSSLQRFRAAGNENGDRYPSAVPSKRSHTDDSTQDFSPMRKGKMRTGDSFKQVLSSYEDELTCPICCDIFVASHVGNPCGHTFCGDCGWQWHTENKNKGCPCCRKTLHVTMPMIPNIAMDNIIERHVKALALNGDQEWEPGARKFQEWEGRKLAWRSGAEKREKKQARQTTKAISSVGTIQVFVLDGGVEEDPTYEDSDVELIPRPVQRTRRQRRGRG